MRFILAASALILIAAPLAAKDSLGVFGDWGAFRDAQMPRCYAIAAAQGTGAGTRSREYDPFASVGTWPRRQVRGQVHFRLSRQVRDGAAITLTMGSSRFDLSGDNGNAWAKDAQMDARIVAEMRVASTMRVSSRDRQGRRFTDSYSLDGAATAMDAASVGCAAG
ncbi:hypothetical protein GCM10009127_16640 [Alteraurantiacibacter aestuarii]|uniref:Uncharacterized protein n=1 Tax=Alteraurantiacibacter aestuarii TaxID=650004 RepID=A0A844ZL69_9SPHN|nr:hypothetical protein [Alteraurantiacibacter aestuarii]MXO87750.1 hypothetical protein [Alteraurantiacibacter aestuarii]